MAGPVHGEWNSQAPPHWMVYFQVADPIQTERLRDAAVKALPKDKHSDPLAVEFTRRCVATA